MADRPYPLTTERESPADGGGYLVSDGVTLVYGYGETLDAALAAYDAALADWRKLTGAEKKQGAGSAPAPAPVG